MRESFKRAVVSLVRRSEILERAVVSTAARTAYESLKRKFIANGKHSPYNEKLRSTIVARFESIDRHVPIKTTPSDGLFLAELLLSMQAPGSIVECGCYAGGSSAKLSIIGDILGREVSIFDSFEGLPAVEDRYLRDYHCREVSQWVTDWTASRYAAQLDQVKSNIRNYGEIGACKFVKGWFRETLNERNLSGDIAFAFTDVDLANSARDCFLSLWPQLSTRGIYVTHDAAYINVLQEIYNLNYRQIGDCPPTILFGAGFGLSDASPHLGYMVKGKDVTSDYLKGLTVNK